MTLTIRHNSMQLVRSALLAVLSSLILAGCGEEPSTVAVPTTYRECNYPNDQSGDPGPPALALHVPLGQHSMGQSVPLYVCVVAGTGGTVTVEGTDNSIEVSPESQVIDPEGSGIVAFRVSVSPESDGSIVASMRSDGGGWGIEGPNVEPDGDGWKFWDEARTIFD